MSEPSLISKAPILKAPILRAAHLCKSFSYPCKVSILNGVNLELISGQSLAIMGRSGEGKTTLLHILGTLEEACSGILEINGKLVTSKNRHILRNQHIGFVFQAYHLLDHYSAIQNVLMPARIAGKDVSKGSDAYLRAEHLLESVGLIDRQSFHTKQLSGGERQRVAIARALCNDPDIILADEPSGNLDSHTSEKIHNLLLDCARVGGKALIVATHDKELASLCASTAWLRDGTLH